MDTGNDVSPVTRGILKLELQGLRNELMDAFEKKLTIRMLQSEAKAERSSYEIKESIGQFRSEIIGHIQDFAGILESYKRETVTIPNTLDQHGKRLDDHDSRIRSLES